MKGYFCYILVAILFINGGCKQNDEDLKLEDDPFNVELAVSISPASQMPLSSNSTSGGSGEAKGLKDLASNIYFRISSESGTVIDSLYQNLDSQEFGILKRKLPPGNYKVFCAASKGKMIFFNQTESGSGLTYKSSHFGPEKLWEDTFTKEITISVGKEKKKEEVRLERAVGALEIKISDIIPVRATKITIVSHYEAFTIILDGSRMTWWGTKEYDFPLVNTDKGTSNKILHIYSGNTIGYSAVAPVFSVKAYDGDTLIAEKVVSNLQVFRNKVTLASINLFNSTLIKINPEWGVPPTPISF